MWHNARGPTLRKDFFWFWSALGRKILQKSQSVSGPTQYKSGQGNNMVCRRNYLLYIFQQQFTSTSPVFVQQNTFEKISYSKGSAHWTNFWTERAWALWLYMYSYNWLFSKQNNNLQAKYLTGLLFTAKILLEAIHFTSLYQGQITYKILPQNARF